MASDMWRICTEAEVDPALVRGYVGFVLLREGAYLMAVAYGGPGKPVPYWTTELDGGSGAKIWKSLDYARGAMVRYGGELRAVRMENSGWLQLIDGWRETAVPEEE